MRKVAVYVALEPVFHQDYLGTKALTTKGVTIQTPNWELNTIAESIITQRLQTIPSVQQIASLPTSYKFSSTQAINSAQSNGFDTLIILSPYKKYKNYHVNSAGFGNGNVIMQQTLLGLSQTFLCSSHKLLIYDTHTKKEIASKDIYKIDLQDNVEQYTAADMQYLQNRFTERLKISLSRALDELEF